MKTLNLGTKRAWIAAFLNLLVIGTGYFYLRERVTFGLLLLLSAIFFALWLASDPQNVEIFNKSIPLQFSQFTLMVATTIDVYNEGLKSTKRSK